MSTQYLTTQREPSQNQTVFIMLLKGGEQYEVTEEEVQIFQQAYPRINVRDELAKMVAWHYSNESKRKTRRGIKRSINSWLNAAKPSQSGLSQRDHVKQTSIGERVTDLSWADGL